MKTKVELILLSPVVETGQYCACSREDKKERTWQQARKRATRQPASESARQADNLNSPSPAHAESQSQTLPSVCDLETEKPNQLSPFAKFHTLGT